MTIGLNVILCALNQSLRFSSDEPPGARQNEAPSMSLMLLMPHLTEPRARTASSVWPASAGSIGSADVSTVTAREAIAIESRIPLPSLRPARLIGRSFVCFAYDV